MSKQRMQHRNGMKSSGDGGWARLFYVATAICVTSLAMLSDRAFAQGSVRCQGGGFSVLGLSGRQRTTVPASSIGDSFVVRGRYVEFSVDAATFGVRDWTLTGAPNPFDLTGGIPTVVFAAKIPDHQGLELTSDVSVDINRESLVITRTAPGLLMKIQAKDCASGGIFQMEPERADGAATVVTHVLADDVFYFDNPNARDLIGERLPCSGILPNGTRVVCDGADPDGRVTVTAKTNFGNDWSDKFVGRDSPQVATRIITDCVNEIPNPFHPGTVSHCGGVSQWSIASGGRMGQVMGEDATEIAPAARVCTADCTAQDRVQGRAVVVGFPFPVPAEVRLQLRLFDGFLIP